MFNSDGSITTIVKNASGDILSETTTGGSSNSSGSASDSAQNDTSGLDMLA
ncbi:hypothetical protein [Acetobacter ghanensis]|uniref:hypothetical protein n=1 Tax=Acetobacter ghanensis TaxID=431306 RepID=UPI001E621577|nr:hypothetical protein [Acetobacter ghanensis]